MLPDFVPQIRETLEWFERDSAAQQGGQDKLF
jgi:hypothetical protein